MTHYDEGGLQNAFLNHKRYLRENAGLTKEDVTCVIRLIKQNIEDRINLRKSKMEKDAFRETILLDWSNFLDRLQNQNIAVYNLVFNCSQIIADLLASKAVKTNRGVVKVDSKPESSAATKKSHKHSSKIRGALQIAKKNIIAAQNELLVALGLNIGKGKDYDSRKILNLKKKYGIARFEALIEDYVSTISSALDLIFKQRCTKNTTLLHVIDELEQGIKVKSTEATPSLEHVNKEGCDLGEDVNVNGGADVTASSINTNSPKKRRFVQGDSNKLSSKRKAPTKEELAAKIALQKKKGALTFLDDVFNRYRSPLRERGVKDVESIHDSPIVLPTARIQDIFISAKSRVAVLFSDARMIIQDRIAQEEFDLQEASETARQEIRALREQELLAPVDTSEASCVAGEVVIPCGLESVVSGSGSRISKASKRALLRKKPTIGSPRLPAVSNVVHTDESSPRIHPLKSEAEYLLILSDLDALIVSFSNLNASVSESIEKGILVVASDLSLLSKLAHDVKTMCLQLKQRISKTSTPAVFSSEQRGKVVSQLDGYIRTANKVLEGRNVLKKSPLALSKELIIKASNAVKKSESLLQSTEPVFIEARDIFLDRRTQTSFNMFHAALAMYVGALESLQYDYIELLKLYRESSNGIRKRDEMIRMIEPKITSLQSQQDLLMSQFELHTRNA